MARKPKVMASETPVVTEPKTVTFAQIRGVAQMSFNGLKGDTHAETRRKIADARKFVYMLDQAHRAKALNKPYAQRTFDAYVKVVNEFQLRYGVVVVKQA